MFRLIGMLEKQLVPIYAQWAKCRQLPIKWINNTREFCPKGQFVYFVANLVKLQVNLLETLNINTHN